MWNRTFAGLITGSVFTFSIWLSAILLFPDSKVGLMTATIFLGFPMIVAVMCWCYSTDSGKKAWFRGGGLALPAATLLSLIKVFG